MDSYSFTFPGFLEHSCTGWFFLSEPTIAPCCKMTTFSLTPHLPKRLASIRCWEEMNLIKLVNINVLMNDPPISFIGIFAFCNGIPKSLAESP